MNTFECSRCGAEKPVQPTGGTGYGVDGEGLKVCYLCCATDDKLSMQTQGRTTLYLTQEDSQWRVSNWPGTLAFVPTRVKKSGHNMTDRHDVWFVFEGRIWHGVNLGDTQILRCRQTKQVTL